MTCDHDAQYVSVAREHLDTLIGLLAGGHEHDEQVRASGRRQGRREATASYESGYRLGHDTGLSARQDTRGFVHGILDGWQAGCQERHQLVEDILRSQQERHLARRQAGREAEAS